jgi:tetratricopeptide (TPR) repeat protein
MKTSIKIILAIVLFSGTIKAQDNAETAFSKSYTFEYDTQYAKAIEALLALKTESYEINLRLGWLEYLSKDYAKSETYYKKALELEPNSIEARFGHVLPVYALGNMNSVLAIYTDILKLDPNNSIVNYRMAYIYYTKKDYVNAMTYVSKVIKAYPFDFDSNLLAGKIMLDQGKKPEAKKYFIKALEYNPQSEDAKSAIKKV